MKHIIFIELLVLYLIRDSDAMMLCSGHEMSECNPMYGRHKESQEKFLRLPMIARFKHNLLRRLGFNQKPSPTIDVKQLDVAWIMSALGIHNGSNNSQQEGLEGQQNSLTTRILLPVKEIGNSVKKTRKLMKYDLQDLNIESFLLRSTRLRIFYSRQQQENTTCNLFLLLQASGGKRMDKVSQIMSQNVSHSSGWLDLDITKLFLKWKQLHSRSLLIDVRCLTCKGEVSLVADLAKGQGSYASSLILKLKRDMHKVGNRQRRSNQECLGNKDLCCKRSFVLSFTDIGWDDWIIHPKTLNIGYCLGSCKVDQSFQPMRTHSEVVRRVQRMQGIDLGAGCCSPTKFKTMEMVYLKNSKVELKQVDDLIVERCGCS